MGALFSSRKGIRTPYIVKSSVGKQRHRGKRAKLRQFRKDKDSLLSLTRYLTLRGLTAQTLVECESSSAR